MPVAGLQVLFMQVVLLFHLVLVCTVQPWRVDKANVPCIDSSAIDAALQVDCISPSTSDSRETHPKTILSNKNG